MRLEHPSLFQTTVVLEVKVGIAVQQQRTTNSFLGTKLESIRSHSSNNTERSNILSAGLDWEILMMGVIYKWYR